MGERMDGRLDEQGNGQKMNGRVDTGTDGLMDPVN